jgi:hypothetical protein
MGEDDHLKKSIFAQEDMKAFSLDFKYSVTAPAMVAVGAMALYLAFLGD